MKRTRRRRRRSCFFLSFFLSCMHSPISFLDQEVVELSAVVVSSSSFPPPPRHLWCPFVVCQSASRSSMEEVVLHAHARTHTHREREREREIEFARCPFAGWGMQRFVVFAIRKLFSISNSLSLTKSVVCMTRDTCNLTWVTSSLWCLLTHACSLTHRRRYII